MQCPKCVKEMLVNATGKYLGVADKHPWRILDKYVEEWTEHQGLSKLEDPMWMRPIAGGVSDA